MYLYILYIYTYDYRISADKLTAFCAQKFYYYIFIAYIFL